MTTLEKIVTGCIIIGIVFWPALVAAATVVVVYTVYHLLINS